MARGLSRKEAKLMISQGLFAELIDEAPSMLKDEVEQAVAVALASEGR
jgi:Fe-S cluster assembly scaffold protein SufB